MTLCFSDVVKRELVLDIANVLYNIISYNSLTVIEQLPPDVLSAFLAFLAKKTSDFCRAAADELVSHRLFVYITFSNYHTKSTVWHLLIRSCMGF